MKDVNALVNQATSIVTLIIGIVILIILAGTVARAARLGIPWLPSMGTTELAYLCGAWWLWRKA